MLLILQPILRTLWNARFIHMFKLVKSFNVFSDHQCVSKSKEVWQLVKVLPPPSILNVMILLKMATTTGGNVNQEEFVVTNSNNNDEVEDATRLEVNASSANSTSNPSNHPMSLNLTIPVRYLYHEQAKSIIAIQVRIYQSILWFLYGIMLLFTKYLKNCRSTLYLNFVLLSYAIFWVVYTQ